MDNLDYFGVNDEWYDGVYTPEAYARVVYERHQGLRLSRVTTGGNLCPWISCISGGRVPMINNQTSQHLPLMQGKPPQYMGGVEEDYANAVFDARLDAYNDVIVISRFNKHRIVPDVVPGCTTEYVVWRDMTNQQIGITEVPSTICEHMFATTKLTRTEIMDNLAHGTVLRKDEVLAYGSSRTKDGNYAYGRDLNWCWLGRYSTNEDAVEVSRRFTKLMTSLKTDTISFVLNGDDTLLNIHGTEDDVRPLPRVGDVIGANGIVAAVRKVNRAFSLIHHRKDNLRKAHRPFDKPYTTQAGSVVVDVTVKRYGRGDFKYMSVPVTRYLDVLADSALHMYREILTLDTAERRHGGLHYARHPSFHVMVRQAEQEMMSAGHKTMVTEGKVRSGLRVKESIPANRPTIGDKPYTYHVSITLTKVHTPELGDKATNRHGSKTVIGKITDDELMSIDKWGRHADVIANPVGVSNRNNPSQLNEHYANDAAFHAFNHIQSLGTWQEKWDYLFGLYSVVSIETAHTISLTCTTDMDKQAHLNSLTEEGLISFISEAGDPTLGVHGVNLLRASKYRPPKDVVTVTSLHGVRTQTKPPVRIAPIYTFMLDKISKYANANNIAPRQALGFVAKATSRDKELTHISSTANRHLGGTEVRSLAANSNPEDAAYTLRTNNSLAAMTLRTERMLDGQLLQQALTKEEVGSGRGLELFTHELNAFGHTLTNGDEDDNA